MILPDHISCIICCCCYCYNHHSCCYDYYHDDDRFVVVVVVLRCCFRSMIVRLRRRLHTPPCYGGGNRHGRLVRGLVSSCCVMRLLLLRWFELILSRFDSRHIRISLSLPMPNLISRSSRFLLLLLLVSSRFLPLLLQLISLNFSFVSLQYRVSLSPSAKINNLANKFEQKHLEIKTE